MLQGTVQVTVEAGKMDYFLRNYAKKGKIKKGLLEENAELRELFLLTLASVTLLS